MDCACDCHNDAVRACVCDCCPVGGAWEPGPRDERETREEHEADRADDDDGGVR